MAFAKLLSGRVAKVTGSNLDSDRSEYISLGNAEPDFGLPDSDNGILSSLSNGTRQFLYPGTGIAIDSGDIDVDVTTTTFNSSGFNHTSSTDLYNVIKDLDQVIGQVTGTDSSGGGAAAVLTDSSLDGDGTTGSPLSLHPNVTGLTLLTVNGNIGVRTTSPGLPLDVNGTIRSNDAVRLTNTGQFTDDTATTTTTSQTVIAQWSATTFGGAKVIVEAKDGSNRHISELLITHNGTTASATEYGTVHTSGSLVTYDVDISGGNVRLLATAASTNSTAYKMMNTLLFS